MSKQQNPLKLKAENIARLASEFFEKYDLQDYAEFARDIAMRLYKLSSKPLEKGKKELWAATIVYALASLNGVLRLKNGLFSADDIAKFFGYQKKTIADKAYELKRLLQLEKDNTYLSKNYISSTKDIDYKFKEFTQLFKKAAENVVSKNRLRNIILKFELQGYPSYRKLLAPYTLTLEDLASLVTISFFTDDLFVPFSISTADHYIVFDPDKPAEPRVGDLLKAPGNHCVIDYEPFGEIKIIFEDFSEDTSTTLIFLDSKGSLIPMGINNIKEMEELVNDKNKLKQHILEIFNPDTEKYTEKILQTILEPTAKYFNYALQKNFLAF